VNNALYYPSIEFQDYEWLWSAALLWDRIYRIVPEDYEPDEPENIRILGEGGEIGIALRPGPYAKEAAEEFLEKVKSGTWDAAALEFDVEEAYTRLHEDKVDVRLRQILIATGKAAAQGEWLFVPKEFESLYMTFLAEKMSRRNNLHPISDLETAWSASTYFKYDGDVLQLPREDSTHQLAVLVIRDFLPQNVLQLTPNDIVRFREKRRVERQRFLSAIQGAARSLSECEDQTVYEDQIKDIKRSIEETLADYKNSLSDLKVIGWTGLKSVSFPVVTKVACAIAGSKLDPHLLTTVSALGIGLGLVAGFKDFRGKRKKLEDDCDYSYLLHLARNWKQCDVHGRDYNHLLSRNLKEFIDD
jgi:hypothetical protein